MTVGVVRLTNIRLQIGQKVYAKKTQSKMWDLFIPCLTILLVELEACGKDGIF